ncbi:MAG: S8 family serine peptidase [Bacteroidetes bacterium]|nr:S8 family serine peptidase [Bacteroidota bacterium]
MNKFLTILLITLLSGTAVPKDYYFYKGKRIDLKPREDKISIILNKETFSELSVRENFRSILKTGDKLTKITNKIYLLTFKLPETQDEILNRIKLVMDQTSIVKSSAKVYYGTSKKVTMLLSDRINLRLRNSRDKEKLFSLNILNNCSVAGNSKDERNFTIKTNDNITSDILDLADKYFNSGLFEYSEPDFIYPEGCLMLSVPNDQYFNSQWALTNTGQLLSTGSAFSMYGDASTVNGIPGSDMNVPAAWDFTTGSENIKIGVIDSGIDSLHPDLQKAGHLLPGYNAFNDLDGSAVDVGNHGTSTAGLIGAVMDNSIGIAGVAPDCKLMSICIFDENGNTSNSVLARAFDTAFARGLDVLNNSWGGGTPSSLVTDAIDNAAINGRNGLGCVILFASGNDGHNPPIYPSVLPNVLSIGASTPHDQAKSPGTGNFFFWGSNYGEDENGDLDMIAPTNCYTLKAGGGYEPNFWGTSATCPNAAGVAALVLSVNNSLNRQTVYSNLAKGCDKIDNVPYDINKVNGKWSTYYGYGRINALNSVRLAAGVDVTPPTINHLNVKSGSSTYPTIINAEILDQDGSAVPVSGENQPKLFYKIKKGAGSWSGFDSVNAFSVNGNNFKFKVPSLGWESEVKYYIRARDVYSNENTFPKHSPNPFWLCYFAVGNITTDMRKFSPFVGADYGATLSYPVIFYNFNILDAKVIIHMRHTYLNDEVIQIFSPLTDANNNRKCLFASNGGNGDNIFDAVVSDSAGMHWNFGTPPYLNGNFRPEYNLRGLNGNNANGIWKILHFDRGITDYAFFDSVKIILSKTTGVTSPSARMNNPSDSIINFDTTAFPDIAERDFYLKNCGTSSLIISGSNFSGIYAPMFSLINTPPVTILPNDSGLFRVRLNTNINSTSPPESGPTQNAILNIQTNDPSKPVIKVCLHTNEPLGFGSKNLTLNVLIEGLYSENSDTMIPDSVTVLLRKSYSPFQIADSSRSVINSSGRGSFNFLNSANDTDYYIVVKHRNGLETWSSVLKRFSSSLMVYNFTDSVSKSFGNNMTLKGSRYCIYSGDVNKDGAIDANDASLIDNSANNSNSGYLDEDLNSDNIIDASDIGLADNNSLLQILVKSP